MLNPILVVFERDPGVVRWVDVDAFDLAGKLLFESFEGKQVVAEDETVIEQS